jgi:RNA polymerase sigma-70 factor (ECF subfamily)
MPIDATELATLIESQSGPLRLWVRSRCGDGDAAVDDVIQEAFCRLAVQAPAPDNPIAWLFRVCRNLAERARRSEHRRRKRERRWADRPERQGPADPVEIAEMLAAVESLEETLREVVVARIWGRLTLDEIGQLCEISTATAFRRYEAALRELRVKLATSCENQR